MAAVIVCQVHTATVLAVVAATDRPQNSAAVPTGVAPPVTSATSAPMAAPPAQDATAVSAKLPGRETTTSRPGPLLTTPPTSGAAVCAVAGDVISRAARTGRQAREMAWMCIAL